MNGKRFFLCSFVLIQKNQKIKACIGPCRTCHRLFHQFPPSLVFICPATLSFLAHLSYSILRLRTSQPFSNKKGDFHTSHALDETPGSLQADYVLLKMEIKYNRLAMVTTQNFISSSCSLLLLNTDFSHSILVYTPVRARLLTRAWKVMKLLWQKKHRSSAFAPALKGENFVLVFFAFRIFFLPLAHYSCSILIFPATLSFLAHLSF